MKCKYLREDGKCGYPNELAGIECSRFPDCIFKKKEKEASEDE